MLVLLIGDDCVEGVVPECGGDAKTWKEITSGLYIDQTKTKGMKK